MRPTLTHPNSERRRRSPRAASRGRRDVERVAHAVAVRAREAGKRITREPSGTAREAGKGITREPSGTARVAEITAERTGAGGPLDVATYSCRCGLIFSAAVSTTVDCPHCGAEQDW
jgi:hypothetical protein